MPKRLSLLIYALLSRRALGSVSKLVSKNVCFGWNSSQIVIARTRILNVLQGKDACDLEIRVSKQ